MATGRGGSRPLHPDEEATAAMSHRSEPESDSYPENVPFDDPAAPEPVPLRRMLTQAGLSELAEHWGVVLVYGIVTVALGLILAVWPGETLVVVAVLVAIQLIFAGAIRIVLAIFAGSMESQLRLPMALTGALSLLVGLLCLRDPVQTVVIIGVLLGAWWLIAGVIDIVGAFLSPVPGRRGWDLAMGAISILAGGFLLIDPRLSLGVLVVVVCTWLFAIGLLAIVAGLRLRSVHRSGRGQAAQTAVPPAPAM